VIPIVPVILSGGSGTRLWPLSRKAYPKQFLNLLGEGTLFQQTLKRIEKVEGVSEILVVANEEHRFIVAEQMRQLGIKGKIILEPVGKNTAPAVALAALETLQYHTDAHLLVLSSDHIITDTVDFIQAVKAAIELSAENGLITFGIQPTRPETGYGYIQSGSPLHKGFKVEKFIEKPNLENAQKMLSEGHYYWNSGMFLFKASSFLNELKTFRPDIYEACSQTVSTEHTDLNFVRFDSEKFDAIPSESIDYAVMEYSKTICMVPYTGGWSDVGSWESLWEVSPKDTNGNVLEGNVVAFETSNSYIRSASTKVAVSHLDHIAIIATDDAVLVTDIHASQNIKQVVESLHTTDIAIVEKHQEVHRPWGFYTTLDKAERFQVKRIVVKPGEKLSFQMHYHRAEHWIVVQGTASVLLNQETHILTENESIHIPLGIKHSLQNPGKIPLEVIEVQSGSYLEEDDIVRFNDQYGRL
jgi:mannose-1-phosphate guanylyltransferase